MHSVPSVVVIHPQSEGEMLTDLRRTALLEVVQKGEAHCSQVYSARKEEALNEIQLILGQFPVVAFVRDQSATPHCKGSEVLLGHAFLPIQSC